MPCLVSEHSQTPNLEALCDGYEDITSRFQTLRKINALNMPIDVTWLEYSHYGEGFCLIVMYGEYPLNNMIYNRSHFLKHRIREVTVTCLE